MSSKIGIYNEEFVDFLRDKLQSPVKITSSNIIVSCPWCEFGKKKSHYHLYISLHAPIFHCFRASCEKKGTVSKLLKAVEGKNRISEFIDQETLKQLQDRGSAIGKRKPPRKVILPPLKPERFKMKEVYIRKRFKFSNVPITWIPGMIFDVYEFLRINDLQIPSPSGRIEEYLHNNFVGFLTKNKMSVIFRNIDSMSDFRYFRYKISEGPLSDYYALNGRNDQSNLILMAEGIFDICSEYLFDYLGFAEDVRLYVSVLQGNYIEALRSVIFHEQIFRPDVIILSDKGVPMWKYKYFLKVCQPYINSLRVVFNTRGKDFGDGRVNPVEVTPD